MNKKCGQSMDNGFIFKKQNRNIKEEKNPGSSS
jgi:hypothetical protein